MNDRALWFFVAILLIAALFLHALHLEHHHPLEFGEGVQALLHGEDRKWLLAALLAALFALVLLFSRRPFLVELSGRTVLLDFNPALSLSILVPVRIALRRGIVHPKLYA